jgi:hypothetical protein
MEGIPESYHFNPVNYLEDCIAFTSVGVLQGMVLEALGRMLRALTVTDLTDVTEATAISGLRDVCHYSADDAVKIAFWELIT